MFLRRLLAHPQDRIRLEGRLAKLAGIQNVWIVAAAIWTTHFSHD
jgi:hypothetical protein